MKQTPTAFDHNWVYEIFEALRDDIQRGLKECTASAQEHRRVDQFWARSLVRSMFAQIEGFAFQVKQYALRLHQEEVLNLSVPDLAVIREESYFLDKSGIARSRPSFVPFEPNLSFVLALYAKIWSIDFELEREGNGWRSLCRAIRIRNRLNHPKKPADLKISKDELEATIEGYVWWAKTVSDLLEARKQAAPPGRSGDGA